MIIPIIGAPGTGKTTVCKEVTRRHGIPHFEMAWMPEFMMQNGMTIPYVEDERIAVCGLVAVAKVYSDLGHRVVLISDFRNEVLPLVWQQLDAYPHQVVRLYSSVGKVLAERVSEPTRPSGYRDVAGAQVANDEIRAMRFRQSLDIDVATQTLERVVEQIRVNILLPNGAVGP